MATKRTSSSVQVRWEDAVSAPSENCVPLLMQAENSCSPSLVLVLFCSCNFQCSPQAEPARCSNLCGRSKVCKTSTLHWLHAPWGAQYGRYN